MSIEFDHWKAQLGELSVPERVELAHFLLSSIESAEDDVEAAWDEEASRRVEEIRSGQAIGRPVEDLLADLREQYP